MNYTIDELMTHLRYLGLQEGDTVLVRASVRKIDDNKGHINNAEKLIRAMLSVVGDDGTIAGLSFTKTFLFPKRHKNYFYNRLNPPITGGFASAMVNWPGSVRSAHPATSFVAIGKYANDLLAGHDENASCFYPMNKLMELDGKMILIGCVKESPGFSTVHLVQDHLGLSTKSIFRNIFGVYYMKEDGRIDLFRKNDIPGCSMGFANFYAHYVSEGKLRTGWIGDAYSVAIKARDAYAIEHALIKKNPKIALCDNPHCESCRGSLFYNISDWPLYYAGNVNRIFKKLFSVIHKE